MATTRIGSEYRRLNIVREYEPYGMQHRAGRYNPAQTFKYKGRIFVLKCGTSDWVSAWSFDGGRKIITISVNSRMGYAGIEEFDREDGLTMAMIKARTGTGESSANAFFQNANEELVGDLNGEDFFGLSDTHQRDIMIPYL